MDYATYTVVFCIVVGLVTGTVVFAVRVACCAFCESEGKLMDRNEDGAIEIFSFWNMSIATFAAIVGLAIASHVEDSVVAQIIKQSWDFFVAQGYLA